MKRFTELPAQAKSAPSVLPEHMPVTVQHSSSLRLRMWSESDLKSALPGEKRGFEISFREQQNMFRLTMASDVRLVVAVGVGLGQQHEVNEKLSRNSNKNPCCSYRAVPMAHAAFRRRSSSRGVRVFVQFGVLVAHNVWIACVASAPTRCKLA